MKSQAKIELEQLAGQLYDDATAPQAEQRLREIAHASNGRRTMTDHGKYHHEGNLLIFRDGSTIKFDPQAGSVQASEVNYLTPQTVISAHEMQKHGLRSDGLLNKLLTQIKAAAGISVATKNIRKPK